MKAIIWALAALALLAAAPAAAGVREQTVAVPVYTTVYYDKQGHTFDLAATLYLRNLDQSQAITVYRLEFRAASGKLVEQMLPRPLTLEPLASWKKMLPHKGGEGPALVLIGWRAKKPAEPPLAQCVVIGAKGQQGISFVLTGRALGSHP